MPLLRPRFLLENSKMGVEHDFCLFRVWFIHYRFPLLQKQTFYQPECQIFPYEYNPMGTLYSIHTTEMHKSQRLINAIISYDICRRAHFSCKLVRVTIFRWLKLKSCPRPPHRSCELNACVGWPLGPNHIRNNQQIKIVCIGFIHRPDVGRAQFKLQRQEVNGKGDEHRCKSVRIKFLESSTWTK